MSVSDLHWGRLPIPPAARRVDPAAVELPSVIGVERGPLLPRGAGRTYENRRGGRPVKPEWCRGKSVHGLTIRAHWPSKAPTN